MPDKKITGRMTFYFPFKLKDMEVFRTFRRRWKKFEKRHANYVQYAHNPPTELMDRLAFVEDKERILSYVQRRIPGAIICDNCSPYATPCIQKDYRYSLSDNISAKEISAVISRFLLEFNTSRGIKQVEGSLLFNVNLDNLVATSIVCLKFDNFLTDDIILLKHCFYQRSLVHIKEYQPNLQACKNCNQMQCLLANSIGTNYVDLGLQTIYQYVYDKTPWLSIRKTPMDCKIRYCLMEIDKTKKMASLTNNKLMGLCTADEGWRYAKVEKWQEKNVSTRRSYKFYLDGCNGLVVTYPNDYSKLKQETNEFFSTLQYQAEHIRPLFDSEQSCIPAIGKRYYPAFIKSVEIAYLINEVNTNDISPKIKSYLNPIVIIHRCYKLWKIIQEVDMNTYHISNDINKSFNNVANLQKIREEYRDLLSHAMNCLLAIVAILTLLVTILSLWK